MRAYDIAALAAEELAPAPQQVAAPVVNTTVSRSGRAVKKRRVREAPGANGEAQLASAAVPQQQLVQAREAARARAAAHVAAQQDAQTRRDELKLAVLEAARVSSLAACVLCAHILRYRVHDQASASCWDILIFCVGVTCAD